MNAVDLGENVRLTVCLQDLLEHEEAMQSLRDELEKVRQESKEQGSVSLSISFHGLPIPP